MTLDQLLTRDDAVFICNHSGGKDSQAMYIFLERIIPGDRLIVIHADLPGMDWPGIEEHIRATTYHEFRKVRASKTFFDMVRRRQKFPSPKYRQCTSDLKRDPINKEIRSICNERGFKYVVNCTGIRAAESCQRSRAKEWKENKRESNSLRTWFEWLPIFDLSTEAVFKTIESAGQVPHWAYSAGMSRLSCSFCIMSNQSDLLTAASLRPDLLEEISDLEREIGFTFLMPGKGEEPKTLDVIIEELRNKQKASEAA